MAISGSEGTIFIIKICQKRMFYQKWLQRLLTHQEFGPLLAVFLLTWLSSQHSKFF